MPVTLINLFDVPAEHDAEFRQRWQQVNDYMRAQPGYLGHTLHQAVAPDARYRYVNVAQWRSADDFSAAHGPEFRALVAQPGWEKVPVQPSPVPGHQPGSTVRGDDPLDPPDSRGGTGRRTGHSPGLKARTRWAA